MNKNFKYFALIWSILLAVFNVICFVTPDEIAGMSKFGGAFWIGYIFITLAFILWLVCAYIALRTGSNTKLFYNIPIIHISYTGLVLTLILGALCMLIPNLANWVAIIVCLIAFAFTAIAVIRAKVASHIVENIDKKVKAKTMFIKSLTVDAESLLARAASPETKNSCKKVFEAIRYSDPMSDDALSGVESQITQKFNEFSDAVNGRTDSIGTIADELVALLGDRNRKCKLLK